MSVNDSLGLYVVSLENNNVNSYKMTEISNFIIAI